MIKVDHWLLKQALPLLASSQFRNCANTALQNLLVEVDGSQGESGWVILTRSDCNVTLSASLPLPRDFLLEGSTTFVIDLKKLKTTVDFLRGGLIRLDDPDLKRPEHPDMFGKPRIDIKDTVRVLDSMDVPHLQHALQYADYDVNRPALTCVAVNKDSIVGGCGHIFYDYTPTNVPRQACHFLLPERVVKLLKTVRFGTLFNGVGEYNTKYGMAIWHEGLIEYRLSWKRIPHIYPESWFNVFPSPSSDDKYNWEVSPSDSVRLVNAGERGASSDQHCYRLTGDQIQVSGLSQCAVSVLDRPLMADVHLSKLFTQVLKTSGLRTAYISSPRSLLLFEGDSVRVAALPSNPQQTEL